MLLSLIDERGMLYHCIVSPVFGLIYFVKIAGFCKERNVYHC